MHTIVDYTAEQVHNIRGWLEQYASLEEREELQQVLAIVREVDRIGAGTEFLTRSPGRGGAERLWT